MHKALAFFTIALVLGASEGTFGPLAAQQPVQQADNPGEALRRAVTARPQPGDRVWLHVWGEPKWSDTVTVDERGQVLHPKIGVVSAASMTIGAFRDTVQKRFAEFLRDSRVDVV